MSSVRCVHAQWVEDKLEWLRAYEKIVFVSWTAWTQI